MHNGIQKDDEEIAVSDLQVHTSVAATTTQTEKLDPQKDVFAGWDRPLLDLGHTHFVGIGGAGMSVLAEMLNEAGLTVTGSDQQENAQTRKMQDLGIPVVIGQSASNVLNAQTVVWSSAIKPDNPEIVAARKQGSVLAHRSDILALLLASHTGVTVAGAHGKSTTSAFLAHILRIAGTGDLADPSYAIGASIQSPQGVQDGGHLGSGQVLVAEADESDGSFEKYHPSIAIITNVEADHLDHYGSSEAFLRAFTEHARHVQDSVVICGDDQGSRRLLQALRHDCPARVVIYTTASETEIDEAGWDVWAHVVRITSERESSGSGREHFRLELPVDLVEQLRFDREHDSVTVGLAVPGIHNARNASAAIIVATILGVELQAAAAAASSFLGASRRFEVQGEERGVGVIDDYAHHPTEIAALLSAARRRYPEAHIHVLFQPHLFSRTQTFARDFARALSDADDVIITSIYPARERASDFPRVSAQTIVDAYHDVCNEQKLLNESSQPIPMVAVDNMTDAARQLADNAASGDVILTVGAGDVTQMGQVILERLRSSGQEFTSAVGLSETNRNLSK